MAEISQLKEMVQGHHDSLVDRVENLQATFQAGLEDVRARQERLSHRQDHVEKFLNEVIDRLKAVKPSNPY